MSIKLKHVVLDLKGLELALTMEEAEALHKELSKVVGLTSNLPFTPLPRTGDYAPYMWTTTGPDTMTLKDRTM